MPAVRTLGQLVEEEGLLAGFGENVTKLNARASTEAKKVGRLQQLPQVQCFTCTAPKTCCSSLVVARLYEGVLVAAELRRTNRDVPALRDELRTRAEAMEAASPYEWRVPCLFLDGRERCTVYAARPTACGTLFVYTPPAACSEPGAAIKAYVAHDEYAVATELEELFRQRLSLRQKVGRRYIGVLPRMVLVALEAWDRTDFRDYLRQLPWPGEHELSRWNRRTS